MAFDHHKLDVYQRALDALDACDRITAQLPRGRAHLRDQIDRASGSIVANIAEGAGEFSPAEKARFYRMARRSAIEVVAWLEIIERRDEAPARLLREALEHLQRVVSMLVKLIRARAR
ncbi:MAG: four helix bundle protein [Sandaracinaceae bacterium]|nr:four helix bundle protein [Sandaracinaceae bacterium]